MFLNIFTDFFQQFAFSLSAYFRRRTAYSLGEEIRDSADRAFSAYPIFVKAKAFRQRHLSSMAWFCTSYASSLQSLSASSGALPQILAVMGPFILSLVGSNPCLGCSKIWSLSLMIQRQLSFLRWQRTEFIREDIFQLQPYWLICPEPQKATMFQKVFRALGILPSFSSFTPMAFFLRDSSTFSSSSILKQFLPQVKLYTLTTKKTVQGISSTLRYLLQSSQSEPYWNISLSLHQISAISAGFILLMACLSILETLQSSRQFLRHLSSSSLPKSYHQSLQKHSSVKTASLSEFMNFKAQQTKDDESGLAVETPRISIFFRSWPSRKTSSMLWKQNTSKVVYQISSSAFSQPKRVEKVSASSYLKAQSDSSIRTISFAFILLSSFQITFGSASMKFAYSLAGDVSYF